MINIQTIILTAIEAGKAILEVYHTNFEVSYKEDTSPLTLADKKAHAIIANTLEQTGIPVLSEEGRDIPYKERKGWEKMWVVDPLDGTKEFVKRNGEFTVNIALVENGIPILGVVYAPILDKLYIGDAKFGAYKIEKASSVTDFTGEFIQVNKLPNEALEKKTIFRVVASRSHLNKETSEFIDNLKKVHPNIEIVTIGSSLKLCMIAEGEADVYPRFAPTMEWDTAAGDAVVRASGGKVKIANTKNDLQYNKQNLLNPWFIVSR